MPFWHRRFIPVQRKAITLRYFGSFLPWRCGIVYRTARATILWRSGLLKGSWMQHRQRRLRCLVSWMKFCGEPIPWNVLPQLLIHLSESGVLCFTATHDIEMTELLKDCYDNYHFEEVIRDGDISFPYELLPGRAGTRNAIRLLALMGYDKEITERAATQAEDFIQTGKWSVQTLLGNT